MAGAAPVGVPPVAHGPQPAEPAPSTAAPEPIVAVRAPMLSPTTAASEPIVAESIAAVPAPIPAVAEPMATVSTSPAVPPWPSSTEPASEERMPIGLPVRRLADGSPPISHEECDRAVHSLRTFSRMPPDLQRAELSKIPGMGGRLDEMMTVMNALPSEAWPEVVASLPREVVHVLLDGPGG
jgi:hypothetical protein